MPRNRKMWLPPSFDGLRSFFENHRGSELYNDTADDDDDNDTDAFALDQMLARMGLKT